MRTSMRRVSIALVALALLAAACSSSDKKAGAAGSGGSNTTSATKASDPAINAWAIQYTGGKAQKATGAPFKIGYVNQD